MNLKVSEAVKKLLQASKSEGTWSQYRFSLSKWTQYCVENNWCPDEINISHYLEFLHSLYKKGLSYSTINTARSTLSTVYGKIDNVPIGEHTHIIDFMKGVSRLRPVQACYTVTWDCNVVLNYLKSIDNTSCSLKELSLKLVSWLALRTGQRVQTLVSIKLNNIK